MTLLWATVAVVVSLFLWSVFKYRNFKFVVTGASGHAHTVFRASLEPGVDRPFKIIYWADGYSAGERDIAASDLLTWGIPFATARRCSHIEICAATNVRAGRFVRRYELQCTPFRRSADGSWSKEAA
jgi:hypothetical protein